MERTQVSPAKRLCKYYPPLSTMLQNSTNPYHNFVGELRKSLVHTPIISAVPSKWELAFDTSTYEILKLVFSLSLYCIKVLENI